MHPITFISTPTAISYLLIFSLLNLNPVSAATLEVGPQRALKLPSEAARLAQDGDLVRIDAGVYTGDVAVWAQNHLVIRGVGQRPQLDAQGKSAENKAIWVLKGNNVTVDNIEFSGAAVPALNGAGIRFEGTNLTLKNCHFHHNQMGILTGVNRQSEILIENSEFNDNTVNHRRYGKLGHNIYIGNIRKFTLRFSYIHDAQTGHNVKSRAQENFLLYNRITDEQSGSSYLVDLPDGGQGYLIGNLFHQSKNSENAGMLSFAAEHNQIEPLQALYIVNNTFVNDYPGGSFLHNHSVATAVLMNNLMLGEGTEVIGPNEQKHNLKNVAAGLRNPAIFDYRLLPGSAAINQGIDPGLASNGFPLRPAFQYRHPAAGEVRPQQGAIDVGANEYMTKYHKK